MKIDEKTYKAMPTALQALFHKCPNPGSDEVVAGFPVTTSGKVAPGTMRGLQSKHNVAYADIAAGTELTGFGDTGSAARFFYCAKASKRDRDEGCDQLEVIAFGQSGGAQGAIERGEEYQQKNASTGLNVVKHRTNYHPTVKPTSLMRYLCRLITPPQGIVLDMFMGSGSTGKAAVLEGFGFIGIEKEAEYVPIIRARVEHAMKKATEVTTQQSLGL